MWASSSFTDVYSGLVAVLFYVPDGSVNDLVEEVVVQVGGCRKTQKFHSEGGDEA